MVAYAALSKRSRGSMEVVLRTSAKVNLALEVLGKRGDGYHEIATVLQAVDLFDLLGRFGPLELIVAGVVHGGTWNSFSR